MSDDFIPGAPTPHLSAPAAMSLDRLVAKINLIEHEMADMSDHVEQIVSAMHRLEDKFAIMERVERRGH